MPVSDLGWWSQMHFESENAVTHSLRSYLVALENSVPGMTLQNVHLVASHSETSTVDFQYLDSDWFQISSGLHQIWGISSQPDSMTNGHGDPIGEHILGALNIAQRKRMKNAFRSGNYRIRLPLFQKILEEAGQQDFYPEIDAFSSKAHARLPAYWSAHSDAFNKTWSGKVLWMNPPIKHLSRIVEKIFTDEAKGIIIVPVRYRANWFISLLYIAISWFDLPLNEEVFEDPFGNPLF